MLETTEIEISEKSENDWVIGIFSTLFGTMVGMVTIYFWLVFPNNAPEYDTVKTGENQYSCIEFYPELNRSIAHIQKGKVVDCD
jgi:hypothetical protein